MDDPRVAIIPNEPTAPHVHLCPARDHEGDLEYSCVALRCRFDIVVLICPTCEGPQKRAWKPHPKVVYTPAAQPQQRVLPFS